MAEYFVDLNYTLSNEDTRIEYDLLNENAGNVFSICGSGARVVPLIAKNPQCIDVVDMSLPQLEYLKLRLQAIKDLSYDEYLFFMGYRGGLPGGNDAGDDRFQLFEKLQLAPVTRQYWQERKPFWQSKGFIALGRWEGHFQKIGKVFRNILQGDVNGIFEAQNLEEQNRLYDQLWPKLRWNSFIRVAASEYVFNKFLYKGHFAGGSDRRTESRAPYQFLTEEFERLFRTQLVRKNYFMQVLFLGKIKYEEGLPLEAHRVIFEKVKAATTQINYLSGNLWDIVGSKPYDFVSLSDTISYLPSENANKILQRLDTNTKPGTPVVIRSFLRAPQAVDKQGWKQETQFQEQAYKRDGTGVYQFHIFTKV
jgi:S-adenosylmethionine-diacylglycerol 3-amino-3-carboxypropyl transferase